MTSPNSQDLLMSGRSRSQIQAFLPLGHDPCTPSCYTLFLEIFELQPLSWKYCSLNPYVEN